MQTFLILKKHINTFFYAYGFELLKEYVPYRELEGTYTSEKKMLDIMKRVFEDSSYELIEIQQNFRKCVDQVYNLNGIKELEEASANSKFVANIISSDFSDIIEDGAKLIGLTWKIDTRIELHPITTEDFEKISNPFVKSILFFKKIY